MLESSILDVVVLIHATNFLRFLSLLKDVKMSGKSTEKILGFCLKIQIPSIPFTEWAPLIYQCIHLARKRRYMKSMLFLLSKHFSSVDKTQAEIESRLLEGENEMPGQRDGKFRYPSGGRKLKQVTEYQKQNVEGTILVYISFALKQDPVKNIISSLYLWFLFRTI